VLQDNLIEEEGFQLDNINNVQGNQINGFDELFNAIDAEDNVQNANAGDNFNENQSSLTMIVSMSTGSMSHNIPLNLAGQGNGEVNQVMSPPLNFIEPEVVAPMIVNGGQPSLNLENFGVLGVGVQNLMLAYHDLDENEDEEMENLAKNNMDNVVLGNDDNVVLAPLLAKKILTWWLMTMIKLIWSFSTSMIWSNLRWPTCSWERLKISSFLLVILTKRNYHLKEWLCGINSSLHISVMVFLLTRY
jgi:hypothetical protein